MSAGSFSWFEDEPSLLGLTVDLGSTCCSTAVGIAAGASVLCFLPASAGELMACKYMRNRPGDRAAGV